MGFWAKEAMADPNEEDTSAQSNSSQFCSFFFKRLLIIFKHLWAPWVWRKKRNPFPVVHKLFMVVLNSVTGGWGSFCQLLERRVNGICHSQGWSFIGEKLHSHPCQPWGEICSTNWAKFHCSDLHTLMTRYWVLISRGDIRWTKRKDTDIFHLKFFHTFFLLFPQLASSILWPRDMKKNHC